MSAYSLFLLHTNWFFLETYLLLITLLTSENFMKQDDSEFFLIFRAVM